MVTTTQWEPRAALDAHAKPISSLKFSRSGDLIASACAYVDAFISWLTVRVLMCASVSRSVACLVAADRSVKVWATSELLKRKSDAAATGADASAVNGSSQPPVALATPQAALYGHEEGVNDASWSHDGYYLVSASDDKTARIWDVEYSKTLSTLGRTSSSMSAFNAHGIAVDAGESLHESNEGHASFVFSAQFNPQGSLIVTASFDETVRFWDVRTGRSVAVLSAHHEPIVSARFNHDGTLLITASYDGLARIWDVATRECLRTIITEPSVPLTHAQFTPNSKFALFGTLDSTVRLWDYAQERCLKTYTGHVNKRFCAVAAFGKPYVSSTSTSISAPLLLCGSEDGRVCLWDVQSAQLVEELKTDAGLPVIAVDHHPEKPIVVASSSKAIHVWERTTSSTKMP